MGLTATDQLRLYPPRRIERTDLAKAKENCQLFRQIGTTEQYADFTASFIKTHALVQSGKPSQLNRSRGMTLFDLNAPAIRDALYPLVCLDLQLYEDLGKQPRNPA